MHKPALLFSLVLAAGAAGALEARSSDSSPSASEPAAPGRELTAQIVAVDTEGSLEIAKRSRGKNRPSTSGCPTSTFGRRGSATMAKFSAPRGKSSTCRAAPFSWGVGRRWRWT